MADQITLQQPLGIDVYSITVFNNNFQQIQTSVNTLLTDIENINTVLPNKFPFQYVTTTDFNVDSIDNTDGIYYLTILPSGTLPTGIPETNNILIISKNSNNVLSEYLLISDGSIYQREISNSAINEWKTITAQVIDNLDSQNANASLSANQGYILNQNKINIYYLNTDNPDNNMLNFDNAEPGIYICDGTATSGSIPNFSNISSTTAENNHYIFESYGKISETAVLQRVTDVTNTSQGMRVNYLNNSSWTWTTWQSFGSSSGGSGNPGINLTLVQM